MSYDYAVYLWSTSGVDDESLLVAEVAAFEGDVLGAAGCEEALQFGVQFACGGLIELVVVLDVVFLQFTRERGHGDEDQVRGLGRSSKGGGFVSCRMLAELAFVEEGGDGYELLRGVGERERREGFVN